MSTANQRRGRSRELDWVAYLREHGWIAYRVDGAGDIIAGKDGETWVIQVKSTVRPYDHFGPLDRERLREEAEVAGWSAALLWWPKGVGLRGAQLIPSDDWP